MLLALLKLQGRRVCIPSYRRLARAKGVLGSSMLKAKTAEAGIARVGPFVHIVYAEQSIFFPT
jgi:hypothetical protein